MMVSLPTTLWPTDSWQLGSQFCAPCPATPGLCGFPGLSPLLGKATQPSSRHSLEMQKADALRVIFHRGVQDKCLSSLHNSKACSLWVLRGAPVGLGPLLTRVTSSENSMLKKSFVLQSILHSGFVCLHLCVSFILFLLAEFLSLEVNSSSKTQSSWG